MKNVVNPLLDMQEYREILHALDKYTLPLSITGPSDSQRAHICHAICSHCAKKGVFIAYNEMEARRVYEDLLCFYGQEVIFFPSKEIMLHDIEYKSYDSIYARLNVLDKLRQGKYSFLVTSAEAFTQKLIDPNLFDISIMNFTEGQRLNYDMLAPKLVEIGYQRVDTVEAAGTFAIRGGIIDIFPVNSDYGFRIELFDDEIDSIRRFDIQTQRSIDKFLSITAIPAREVIYSVEQRSDILNKIENELKAFVSRFSKNELEAASNLKDRIKRDIERFENDYYFPGIDKYIAYIIDKPATIADYTNKESIIFIEESGRLEQRVDNILLEHHEMCKNLLEKGQLIPGSEDIFFSFDDIKDRIKSYRTVFLNAMTSASSELLSRKNYNIVSRQIGSYQGHMELFIEDLKNWKQKGYKVVVLSGTRGRGERLVESLGADGIEALYSEDYERPIRQGEIFITHGSLHKGFEYPLLGLSVVSDREVFGQDKKSRKTVKKEKGASISLFTDLNIGDFVVHQAHGVGQYVGIQKLVVENIHRDYLKIRYQEGSHLYIPTNQLDLIQKYIGSEGKAPKLNKLGGTEWTKTKSRVKESLKELAEELIKLYAQRQAAKGFKYGKDTVWQNQFEELFPYEETDDQLKCIEEIKKDMESERVMDRLLCGDVGYGKTEVAIRAIFKAVMDGKQVAYLVPTTILAQQHFLNFVDRMRDFPVTVEVMSRFRTQKEQKRVVKDLKAGMVDVLVGTHRLLQKDIEFKNLGLLIVDEEQRFGVSHKEKLKNIKTNVDVLTLTATPIPRTLHMSLVGIRDISVLEDPPEERYPVQTYVMEHNNDIIKDAIIRELGRKGQTFYLYNRVRTIDLKAMELQNLVPEARIAIAHGQMSEKELEDIMIKFTNNEYDVLVCTTIIESGLDLPNANTIIVEDADHMGLSQLYQIRGRVGRSNRLAYAYITYKKDKVISEVAEKRLQAIKEFTEFGSGFKIAMRDLEIRGAGNLLGSEQHGHMETVGYDMYCKLLDEAVHELKGEPAKRDEQEVSIDINLSAFIDDKYIQIESRKLEMYKKIASIQNEQDAIDIVDELTDRYGDLPIEVSNLIGIACIKALAGQSGFSSVTEKNEAIVFQLAPGRQIDIQTIGKLSAKYKRQMLFNAGKLPYLMFKLCGIQRNKILENIKIMLQDIIG